MPLNLKVLRICLPEPACERGMQLGQQIFSDVQQGNAGRAQHEFECAGGENVDAGLPNIQGPATGALIIIYDHPSAEFVSLAHNRVEIKTVPVLVTDVGYGNGLNVFVQDGVERIGSNFGIGVRMDPPNLCAPRRLCMPKIGNRREAEIVKYKRRPLPPSQTGGDRGESHRYRGAYRNLPHL